MTNKEILEELELSVEKKIEELEKDDANDTDDIVAEGVVRVSFPVQKDDLIHILRQRCRQELGEVAMNSSEYSGDLVIGMAKGMNFLLDELEKTISTNQTKLKVDNN